MRFTGRRMLAGVAVVTLALVIVLCVEQARQRAAVEKRREHCLRFAYQSRHFARRFRQAYEKGEANIYLVEHGPPHGATPPLVLKWAEFYESESRKYELAATHSSEPIPPSPTAPEVFPPGAWSDGW